MVFHQNIEVLYTLQFTTIDKLSVFGKGDLLGSREKWKARTIKSTELAPKLTAALKELQMSTIGVQTFV